MDTSSLICVMAAPSWSKCVQMALQQNWLKWVALWSMGDIDEISASLLFTGKPALGATFRGADSVNPRSSNVYRAAQ